MVELMLMDELCKFIQKNTENYMLETSLGMRPPVVINGFLPPKRDEDEEIDEEFCILVRLTDGEDDFNIAEAQAKSIARTTIVVRTSSESVQEGMGNTLNLMNRIKQSICSSPILVERFRATFPIKWKAPEGNSFPIWQGEITIPWIVPATQEIVGGIYGE